jgi:hypothetical protein
MHSAAPAPAPGVLHAPVALVDAGRAALGGFWLCGRWFAAWQRDPDAPSPYSRELVHVEADPPAPLGLVLHAL